MKLIVLCLITALFAGCAVYAPKHLDTARTAAAFESRTLDAPGLRNFLEKNLRHEITPWPPTSWDLPTLTLTAFYYHPDLDTARASWGVAEAGKITAGQRPDPSIGFTPQHHSDTAGGTLSPWSLGFNLDIPIETAGKRGYRILQAEKRSDAARLHIADAAWRVRSRLESSLCDLYAEMEAEPLLQRQEAAQAEVVSLLEARLAAGEASLPDVTRSRLALERIRLLKMEARKRLAQSRVALASALGVPKEAVDGLDISFGFIDAPFPLPAAGELRRQALTNRPDILALLSDYEAAEAALRLEIAAQYPDLRLGPGYQWDQGDDVWSIGFSVTLPVFNRNRGPIAQAQARREEAAARFAALQARVSGEVDQALAGYRALLDKLATADAALAAQRTARNSVEALFEAGETDRLALAGASLEMESSALDRLEALSGVLRARGVLEDALQRPLPLSELLPADVEANPRPEKED
ncbi:TolC family protein [Geomonas oryzae]|uniref:TolC family protein n=1 Tax=Geomonas oryzae TaxID=2364273 RepID=UPI0013A5D9B1|nr:TolC family protein [Geomonas oryzae]